MRRPSFRILHAVIGMFLALLIVGSAAPVARITLDVLPPIGPPAAPG